MRPSKILLITIAALAPAVSGCRWLGAERLAMESRAESRQLTQRGIAAVERGEHRRADVLLAQAVEACEGDPEARRHWAESLWRRGSRSEAIAQMEEAVRLDEEDATLQVLLAEMYLSRGQMERARRSAERAIDLNPKLASAWAIRGRVMCGTGQFDQALADFHRALGYDSGDGEVLLQIALLHQQANRPQQALVTLHTLADTYSPGEEPQEVLQLTAAAYVALGRYEEGVESLQAAIAAADATPDIYLQLAEAQLGAGRPAEAAAAARQTLALSPDHAPARALLARLQAPTQPHGPMRR